MRECPFILSGSSVLLPSVQSQQLPPLFVCLFVCVNRRTKHKTCSWLDQQSRVHCRARNSNRIGSLFHSLSEMVTRLFCKVLLSFRAIMCVYVHTCEYVSPHSWFRNTCWTECSCPKGTWALLMPLSLWSLRCGRVHTRVTHACIHAHTWITVTNP